MKASNWEKYVVCKDCGWFKYLPFGDIIFACVECCPKCGGENFTVKTKRFNRSKVRLWNPLTWFKGYWETKK